MDYFREAFGGFAPQSDRDAALKLSLDALLADQRIDDLTNLLTPADQLDGVEGEPGWIIERRADGKDSAGNGWPENAQFRAYVNPKIYSLAHPEFYCDGNTFYSYVRSIIDVYAKRHPEEADSLEELRRIIMPIENPKYE